MPMYSYENGEYVMFYRDNGDVLCRIEEVAIAFSKESFDGGMWTLHKHGSKEAVQRWYDNVTKKYREAGLDDIADEMVMIVGKFPVDELNRTIETSGYIKKMIEKLGLEV